MVNVVSCINDAVINGISRLFIHQPVLAFDLRRVLLQEATVLSCCCLGWVS